MRDREGNVIEMAEIPNEHTLIWGQSGQGKTYFSCRQIETEVSKGKRVLVVDFSGSYSLKELQKNKVKFIDRLEIRDVSKDALYWKVPCQDKENFIAILSGALLECLNITSFYQTKWLKKALAYHFEKHLFFSVPSFMDSLEQLVNEDEIVLNSVSDEENIAHLLSRLMPFENLHNFKVYYAEKGTLDVPWKQTTVLQISGFADKERRFLAEIILNLLWAETRLCDTYKRFDVLALDEVQFLSLKRDRSFSNMLREGRKYGIALVLATQFLSTYDKEERETLMQAGHFLVFRPSANDISFSARMIALDGVSSWRRILGSLQIGQAVLVGPYRINENKSVATTPIVCEI